MGEGERVSNVRNKGRVIKKRRTRRKHRSRQRVFVWLVGFLISSTTTILYRGRVSRLTSDNYFYVLPHGQ